MSRSLREAVELKYLLSAGLMKNGFVANMTQLSHRSWIVDALAPFEAATYGREENLCSPADKKGIIRSSPNNNPGNEVRSGYGPF